MGLAAKICGCGPNECKPRYTITTNPAAQIIRLDFGGPVTAVGLTLAECEAMVEELEGAMAEVTTKTTSGEEPTATKPRRKSAKH